MIRRAVTANMLLQAYSMGVFPMAESRGDPTLHWIDPQRRGILPLEAFHISRSLRRRLLADPYRLTVNADFAGVVRGCADRPTTWINTTIIELSCELHALGHAHSLEAWNGDELAGGVYGVAISGAFFAESMFSRRRDASKIALAYLVDRLRIGGFTLFDTQFLTPHLASLGGVEIDRSEYHRLLGAALQRPADFHRQRGMPSPQEVVQRNTQTSNRA
jgi:leucyl/phenylalanyl-tRNA---protein transferase